MLTDASKSLDHRMPLTLNKIDDRKGKLSKSNCMILIKSTSDVII
jgi:hypothetical protein